MVPSSTPRRRRLAALALGAVVLAACKESETSTGSTAPSTPPTYAVGGDVTGLDGTLELELVTDPPVVGGLQSVTLTADGPYAFAVPLPAGAQYTITIASQPADQLCTLSNATGTVGGAAVTDVDVLCQSTYFVGVTVSGLAGAGLTLVLNGGAPLAAPANGAYTFPTPLVDGESYAVTVGTQPTGQVCLVANGSGTIAGADVSNVTATCNAAFGVGGTVTGLAAGGLVLKLDPGIGPDQLLALQSNGLFAFPTPVTNGATYAVTVETNPPGQVCNVTNGSGTISGAPVTDVQVECVSVFTVGGTVTGLTGAGLVLNLNGTEDLPIAADGPFTFTTALADLQAYTVAVTADPAGQVCDLTNATGSIAGANVTDVQADCVDLFTVGGTLAGLTGTGLVLQVNGGDDLAVAGNGAYQFATPLPDGSAYAVTVLTHPTDQLCTLANASGTLAGSDVTNVNGVCVEAYPVSGAAHGIGGPGLVLQSNGGDDLPIAADGPFTFATPVPVGMPYAVTVLTPPAGQVASLVHPSGTSGPFGASDVGVWCGSALYTVGGRVLGLGLGNIELSLNDSDELLAVTSNGPFGFPTPLADGTPYSIEVSNQPFLQHGFVLFGEGPVDPVDTNDNTNALVVVFDPIFASVSTALVGFDESLPARPHEVDPGTAAPTGLLADGFGGRTDVRALDHDEAQDVYWAADAVTQELLEVDALGAVVSVLGPIGFALEGLGWRADDTLYGVAPEAGGFRVIRIDQTTGAGTALGVALGAGSPDAATVEKVNGNLFVATSDAPAPASVTLYELSLDPAPAIVQVHALGAAEGRVTGLAYDDKSQRLLATRSDGSAQELDPLTGAVVASSPGLFAGWPSVEGLGWEDASSAFGAVHSSAADGTALLRVTAVADAVHAVRSLGRAGFEGVAEGLDGTVYAVRGTSLYTVDRNTGDTRYHAELPGGLVTDARGMASAPGTGELIVVGA
ncbi:MAG TPA: hypothetical protein VJP77_03225, partial [Planctomycetota bacterium]|nr:hypothetical protein [Planctomycetota bacterium]